MGDVCVWCQHPPHWLYMLQQTITRGQAAYAKPILPLTLTGSCAWYVGGDTGKIVRDIRCMSDIVSMLEPKITRTPKKTCTHHHRQKRQTTPNNLPKWPKHYPTAPSPMTDFSHYLAKNHATKNVIELKWAPGSRAQYGQTPWGSATVWSRINHGQ